MDIAYSHYTSKLMHAHFGNYRPFAWQTTYLEQDPVPTMGGYNDRQKVLYQIVAMTTKWYYAAIKWYVWSLLIQKYI